ncbi:hypothetical protein GGR57DRAFT_461577 [Xylariaceae sp. FL1272]|nr:hypothetical protein GGR57DRAFT_461577 [Xylariaceae sp. FL1272]
MLRNMLQVLLSPTHLQLVSVAIHGMNLEFMRMADPALRRPSLISLRMPQSTLSDVTSTLASHAVRHTPCIPNTPNSQYSTVYIAPQTHLADTLYFGPRVTCIPERRTSCTRQISPIPPYQSQPCTPWHFMRSMRPNTSILTLPLPLPLPVYVRWGKRLLITSSVHFDQIRSSRRCIHLYSFYITCLPYISQPHKAYGTCHRIEPRQGAVAIIPNLQSIITMMTNERIPA